MVYQVLLFKSYFANGKQYLEINNSKSFVGDVIYGVPQGSGLGPFLFSIYLNIDLWGQLCMFADDI